MTGADISRRDLLKTAVLPLVGLSGCVSVNREPAANISTTPGDDETTVPGTNTADGTVRVASLSVTDYILYPLAGTHPHVHRRANTQYVVVRFDTSLSVDSLRNHVTVELDGDSVPLADRQPVPWMHDTTDFAFAVSKDESFEGGQITFDRTTVHSFTGTTIDRLNTPPVFEVGQPSVSPTEVGAGERIEATVAFDLTNTGNGRGEFGASLEGNVLSGSQTLTATLDPDAERRITGTTRIAGEGEVATVRLDWGADEWSTDIPVV